MEVEEIKKQATFIRLSFVDNMEKYLLEFEMHIRQKKNFELYWIENNEVLIDQLAALSPTMYSNFCFSPPLLYLHEKLQTKLPKCKNISIEDLETSDEIVDFLVVKGDFGVIENGNIVLLDNAAQNGFNQLKHLVIILDINNFVIKQDHLDFLLYVKGLKKPFTDIKVVSSAYKKIESTPFFATDTTVDEMEVPVTVFLVDNGITEILKDPFFKPVLYCIDCGICGQVCPVSQLHKNETPIGLVKKFLNPQVNKKQNIAQFTTLCGNCAKECPIHIPITDMMRHEVHLSGNTGFISRAAYKFKYFFNRNKMNKLNDKIYRYLFINKQFGQNSILKTYFLNQKTSFFNIQQKDNASE